MELKNTANRFGKVEQYLHWLIALLVLVQYYLVYWKQWVLTPQTPLAKFYINGLHKPLGMVIILLTILATLWRFNNIRPGFPSHMASWERHIAQLTHGLLTLCLLVMPISGVVMTLAAGFPPSFFGLYQLPQLIAHNDALAHLSFSVHSITSYLFLALIVLHTSAALKHHFINKDDVLRRMLP